MACPLDAELAAWDGKDTTALEKLFREKKGDRDFLRDLITFCDTRDLQRGATWLIKYHFDSKGAPLSANLARVHVAQFAGIDDWQAKLHILQYLEHLDLPDDAEALISGFLDAALLSDQKFVRAWAYHGTAVLARRFPVRLEKTRQFLAEAQSRETAASVKVRIRKALEMLAV